VDSEVFPADIVGNRVEDAIFDAIFALASGGLVSCAWLGVSRNLPVLAPQDAQSGFRGGHKERKVRKKQWNEPEFWHFWILGLTCGVLCCTVCIW